MGASDGKTDGETRGRIRWAPTATMGVQFFRCGVDGERGDMYAAEAGSALDSEQTGMRILGFSGYVRAKHVRSFPKVIFRNIPCVC